MSCSLLLLCGGYLWRATRRGDGDDKIRGGRFVRSVIQRFSARRFAYWSLDPDAWGDGVRQGRAVDEERQPAIRPGGPRPEEEEVGGGETSRGR